MKLLRRIDTVDGKGASWGLLDSFQVQQVRQEQERWHWQPGNGQTHAGASMVAFWGRFGRQDVTGFIRPLLHQSRKILQKKDIRKLGLWIYHVCSSIWPTIGDQSVGSASKVTRASKDLCPDLSTNMAKRAEVTRILSEATMQRIPWLSNCFICKGSTS